MALTTASSTAFKQSPLSSLPPQQPLTKPVVSSTASQDLLIPESSVGNNPNTANSNSSNNNQKSNPFVDDNDDLFGLEFDLIRHKRELLQQQQQQQANLSPTNHNFSSLNHQNSINNPSSSSNTKLGPPRPTQGNNTSSSSSTTMNIVNKSHLNTFNNTNTNTNNTTTLNYLNPTAYANNKTHVKSNSCSNIGFLNGMRKSSESAMCAAAAHLGGASSGISCNIDAGISTYLNSKNRNLNSNSTGLNQIQKSSSGHNPTDMYVSHL